VARPIEVFFYGLFMDEELLGRQGIVPTAARPAFVDGFALRIGQRATLVPVAGARAYGMLMALTAVEIAKLYAAPGLERYRPEAVAARPLGDRSGNAAPAVPALCYNLVEPPAATERNPSYGAELKAVLERLGFPAEYAASIE
jgi:hypothetical protein